MTGLSAVDAEQLTDEQLVQRVLEGETACFEVIMRRYNRRLYRAARSVVRNDAEAEDVTQEAYVLAYQHLDQFAGRASFSSWLTRIAINEALARVRRRARIEEIDAMDESTRDSVDQLSSHARSPEHNASNAEVATLLEQSIENADAEAAHVDVDSCRLVLADDFADPSTRLHRI